MIIVCGFNELFIHREGAIRSSSTPSSSSSSSPSIKITCPCAAAAADLEYDGPRFVPTVLSPASFPVGPYLTWGARHKIILKLPAAIVSLLIAGPQRKGERDNFSGESKISFWGKIPSLGLWK